MLFKMSISHCPNHINATKLLYKISGTNMFSWKNLLFYKVNLYYWRYDFWKFSVNNFEVFENFREYFWTSFKFITREFQIRLVAKYLSNSKNTKSVSLTYYHRYQYYGFFCIKFKPFTTSSKITKKLKFNIFSSNFTIPQKYCEFFFPYFL